MIDTMHPEDWPAVRAIYLEGIATGQATFETEAPPWEEWDAKHLATPRLVAREAGGGQAILPVDSIAGWAALSRVSARAVYRGVAEVSVYVAAAFRGRGVGHQLLAGLVSGSEEAGIWTLQASIFPENEASVALHLRHGFRIVGRRERIACQNGVWRDTVLLERRSRLVS
jgi:L-amino acid N-acyltransferase YncA